MPTKRIPIASLKVGMYVCGVDRPWMETPFLVHRFLIKHPSQIAKLEQCGVQEVEIDLQRGLNPVDDPAAFPPDPTLSDSNSDDSQPTTPLAQIFDAAHCEAVLSHLSPSLAGQSFAEEFSSMQSLQQQMLEEVSDILHSIRTSGVVQGNRVKNLVHTIMAETIGHEAACLALIRTRQFSLDLYDHSLSVGTLAVLLGRLMGYEDTQLSTLAIAALLHDIGLLKLPKHLLRPQERRSPTDHELFQSHPMLGVELLKGSSDIPADVLQIVAEHHTALDSVLEDAELPYHHSRLIRVVDEYDELLSGQGGGSPLSVKDALRELYLRGQRNQLDQTIVAHLISQVGIYPIYSLVELNTGERGIVTAHAPGDLLRPLVLLIQNANRQPLPEPIPIRFSAENSQEAQLEIVNVLDPEQEGIRIDHVLANWVSL